MGEESEGTFETRDVGEYRDRIVNGPIIRTLFWLGIPPLLNQIVLVAYNVADAYWLSSYSEVTVAVPRQVFPVIMLFQALSMALTTACLSIVSQYIGGKAYKKASLEASRFFTLSFISGAILNILLLAMRTLIFSLVISTPPEIFDDVTAYSGIVAFDVFLMYIAIMYTTLLQSVGDTRRPSVINVVAVGVNVLLDPFLVLGIGPFPRLGVIGAAITDVLGKIISIIGQAYVLRRKYPELRIAFTKNINTEWVRLVLSIGLPILVFGLMNGFAFLMQQRLVNTLGIIVATAFSIGFIIMNIVQSALFGLGSSTAIMIGQSLGADMPERARKVALKSALLMFTVMTVGAVVIYTFRHTVIGVFVDDQNIFSETDQFLRMLLPTIPFFGLFMNSMSIGRGSGHTVFPTTLDIMRNWIVTIALGYLLAFTFGAGSYGIWLASSVSNIVCGVIAVTWMKYGNWARAIVKKDSAQGLKP